MALFAVVDAQKCCGYGLCALECPEVFHLDENGFAKVPEARVPAALEGKARDAAGSCPEMAIMVGEKAFEESE